MTKKYLRNRIIQVALVAVFFLALPSISHADITTGLVGHWDFNETSGAVANDNSSSNIDGTIQGSPTLGASGQIGTAFTFGTTGQKVNLGDTYGSTLTATSTISVWVKPNGANASNGYIIHKYNIFSGNFVLRDFSGVWHASAFNVGSSPFLTAAITSSAWQHLVFVYEPSGTVSLYKDGVLASSKTVGQFGTITSTPIDVTIGDHATLARAFNGSIDDVRIYNRALSSGDVTQLYAYNGVDSTAPVISSVASSTTSTTATITWTTDESATSTVDYGTTVSYGTASSSSALVTSHSITLTGLTAATLYHFRVSSGDAVYNQGVSSDYTFTTAATPNQDPSVQVMADFTLTLPTNSFTATSTSSDSDGTIVSYLWTEVSSIGSNISASNTATASISDLTPGTYTFRLTVTDDDTATSNDTVVVTVAAGAVATACPAKKIAVLGSSTSDGLGLSVGQSYVDRLRTYLTGLNASHTVTNFAASGYDTYNIMPTSYTPPVDRPAVDVNRNITRALADDPDLILVNMPSNDQADGYEVSETQSNFQTIITAAHAVNVPVWITTTQPRSDGLTSNTERARLIEVKDWINSTYGIFAIDFWTGLAQSDGNIIANPYSQGDGVHINAAGHQKLLSRVLSNGMFEVFCGDTPPTVSLTSPADGTTVGGASVALAGSASDDMLVKGVQFKRTNTSIGTEDTVSSYSTTWDTTGLSDGSYTITAVARDVTGNYATSSSRSLLVDNTAPIISNGLPATELPADTTSTSLTVDTNETALCRYSTSSNTSFGSMTNFSATNSTSHSTTVGGLSAFNSFNYYVKCQDGVGNTTSDSSISFTVAAATVPVEDSGGTRPRSYGTSVQKRLINLINNGNTLAAQALIDLLPNQFPGNQLSPPSPGGEFARDLKLGLEGDDVRTLQNFLVAKSVGLFAKDLAQVGVTGYFGTLTQNALIEYQKFNGIIPAVGYFGPLTKSAVANDAGVVQPLASDNPGAGAFTTNLYVGSESADVTRLQQALLNIPEVYPSKIVTGFFGPLTEEAVGRFQLKYGILSSIQDVGYGGFGPVTRAKLNSLLGN